MALLGLECAQQHAPKDKRSTYVLRRDLTQLEIAIPPSEAAFRALKWKPLPERPVEQAKDEVLLGFKSSALHRSSSVRYQYPRVAKKRNDRPTADPVRNRSQKSYANASLSPTGKAFEPATGDTVSSSGKSSRTARKPIRSTSVNKSAAAGPQQSTISSAELDPINKSSVLADAPKGTLPKALPKRDARDLHEDVFSLSMLAKLPLQEWSSGHLDVGTRPSPSVDEILPGTTRTSRAMITAPQVPRQQNFTHSLCSNSQCSTHTDSSDYTCSAHMLPFDLFTDPEDEIDTDSVYPASPSSSPLHAKWPYVPELFHGSCDAQQLAAEYRTMLMEEMLNLQTADNKPQYESRSDQQSNHSTQPITPDRKFLIAAVRECSTPAQVTVSRNVTQIDSDHKDEFPALLNEQRRDSGIAVSPYMAPRTMIFAHDMHDKDNEAVSPLCLDNTEMISSQDWTSGDILRVKEQRQVSKPLPIHSAFRTEPLHDDYAAREHRLFPEELSTLSYADFKSVLKNAGLSAEEKLVAIETRIREIDKLLLRSQERKGEAEREIATLGGFSTNSEDQVSRG